HLSKTQCLQLAYQENLQRTDMIIKDEGARRLRIRILLLENENDELHEQLALADDRNDVLEQSAEELRRQLSDTQEDLRRQGVELRVQGRELNNMKAELSSMNGVTSDSAKILTEKLSLARELASLKPELEHLRSQSLSQQTILAEKLSLQRQVSTLEVELETEKRACRRAAQKSQTSDREIELQNQLDTLNKDIVQERREKEKARRDLEVDFRNQLDEAQKALTREKKGKEKACKEVETELQHHIDELQKALAREQRSKDVAREEIETELQRQVEVLQKMLEREKRSKDKARVVVDNEMQSQIDELEKELAREKQANESARKNIELDLQGQVAELQRELALEKDNNEKTRKAADEKLQSQIESLKKQLEEERRRIDQGAGADMQSQLEELRTALDEEKRGRERARQEVEKELAAVQTRGAVLESKLDQFRSKLRTTKELLKECQSDLTHARATITKAVPHCKGDVPAKKGRKREALEMSTDVNIGTPDGLAVRGKRAPAKRGRADQTIVGEKSLFSITPFLNRTVTMDPDTPGQDAEIAEEDEQELEKSYLPNEKLLERSSKTTGNDGAPTPSVAPKPKGQKNAPSKLPTTGNKILGESKANTKPRKPAAKKASKKVSTLEKVAEEEDEENNNSEAALPVPTNEVEKPAKAASLKPSVISQADCNSHCYMSQPASWVIHRAYCARELPWSSPKSARGPIGSTTLSSRTYSSSSSTRWKSRQGRDTFAREAKVQGLKSRAAFKLLEVWQPDKNSGGSREPTLDSIGKLDLLIVLPQGYAPGSWSQVAVERTKPSGRVVGIDIIPAQPPKGVSTIQGNFLSPGVQTEVKRFLSDPDRGRPKQQLFSVFQDPTADEPQVLVPEVEESYIDHERHVGEEETEAVEKPKKNEKKSCDGPDKTVDVVLSDMSEPWPQTTGFWKRSLSDPYIRMMNTSGINFKDHAGSMDLCAAALQFAHDTLRVGGHFVCKFYQGSEDKELERQLRVLFKSVHREKPESSRSESKEAYFVALRRKNDAGIEEPKSTDDVP
ncbi:FtsJ-like methyltransferase, partial [Diplocarpon rosae]